MKKINDEIPKVKLLKKMHRKLTVEGEILGLHEAVTKLWVTLASKKNKSEIGQRLANILVGVISAADSLGIEDIDRYYQRRLEELSNVKNN